MRKLQSGFTLIQVCITLVVVSLMMVSAMNFFRLWLKRTYISRIDDSQQAIQEAMKNFYIQNGGRFPCPADPTLSPTNANYGKSINAQACSTSDPLPAGTPSAGGVIRGAVPVRSIGLSDEYMREPSGHLLLYVVTQALTKNGSGPVPPTGGTITNGLVDIRDARNSSWTITKHAYAAPSPCAASQSIPAGLYLASYAIISPGKDGVPDPENTDSDAVFRGGTYACLRDVNGNPVFRYRSHIGD